jgi:hypothetical protein
MAVPTCTDFQLLIKKELAETFAKFGLTDDIAAIRATPSVADGTSVYAVGRGNERAVLLVSPLTFPCVVAEEQTKAAEMRDLLGEQLGSVILSPLVQGTIVGRSYALLPFRRQFNINRLVWLVQKPWIKKQLLEWVHAVNEECQVAATSTEARNHFRLALEHLNTMPISGTGAQAVAAASVDRLLMGTFTPFFVPMHNDLWMGNILRSGSDRSKERYPFVVIDWRGSQIRGCPLYDLVRVSLSLRLPQTELRNQLARATRALSCDPIDARTYVAAALGGIAMRMDQFARDRFSLLARDCLGEIERAGI